MSTEELRKLERFLEECGIDIDSIIVIIQQGLDTNEK